MRKAKKASTQTANRKRTASLFTKYLVGLLALFVVLNGAGGYWAYGHWILAAEEQAVKDLSQDYAEEQAAVVESYFNELGGKLRNLASREILTKALVENNTALLDALKSSLRSDLEQALDIRLLKTGSARLDRDSDTPIRFAELDMINRAEKRELVLPEAARIGDQWRINLVEPLPFANGEEADAPVAGVLFITVALADLRSHLSAADPDHGRTTLVQQYPQQSAQTLMRLGQGDAGTTQQAAVENTHLLIRFTPSSVLTDQAAVNPAGLFAGLAALAAASFGFAFFAARTLSGGVARRHEAPDEDDESAIHAAMHRQPEEDDSVLDLEVSQEDSELLNMKPATEEDPLDIQEVPPPTRKTTSEETDISAEIFRAYDIRGVVDTQLSPSKVVLIGQAIGSQALATGETTLVVGRDGRSHSPDIAEQLIEGILATGCNVVNIGMVPTPLLYFACSELDSTSSGVMVTASHNPPEHNGFKIVIKGDTLKDSQIQHLRARILQKDFAQGAGKEDFADYAFPYIDRVFSDVALAGEISLVIDAGNGVTGDLAPGLFEELGCTVTPLFCDVDGTFPNHQPDPSVAANLQALIEKVKEVGADLGIALDGDGDRVVVVTASGDIVPADRLLMVLAKDIVSRNPGADVVFDVKCSRELNNIISSYGGRPIMWKSGHSHMKSKMQETGALLGGELSGHIFIKERWYGFDDGLYAAARVIEIMSLREQDLDSILENFPVLPATPEIKISVDDDKKFSIVKRLIQEGDFGQGRATTIDGLRVDFPEGWGLVRVSNTSAALTLRFEGETEAKLSEIMSRFKEQLLKIEPDLHLDF